MQQAAAGQMIAESANIGAMAAKTRSRSVNGRGFTGNPAVERAAERFEIADDFPDGLGRLREHGAVIGLCLAKRPQVASDGWKHAAWRREAATRSPGFRLRGREIALANRLKFPPKPPLKGQTSRAAIFGPC